MKFSFVKNVFYNYFYLPIILCKNFRSKLLLSINKMYSNAVKQIAETPVHALTNT